MISVEHATIAGAVRAGQHVPHITGTGAHGAVPREGTCTVPVESSGHSPGNPRLFELIEHAPKTGKSPTVWAWPELIDYLKVAGQPVQGPWPPHQQARPDPDEDSLPIAVPDPEAPAARQAVGPDELGGPDSIDPHRSAH
jgi:hypothetical protein